MRTDHFLTAAGHLITMRLHSARARDPGGDAIENFTRQTSGYATWFTTGGAIRIAHYDVIDDVITRKL